MRAMVPWPSWALVLRLLDGLRPGPLDEDANATRRGRLIVLTSIIAAPTSWLAIALTHDHVSRPVLALGIVAALLLALPIPTLWLLRAPTLAAQWVPASVSLFCTAAAVLEPRQTTIPALMLTTVPLLSAMTSGPRWTLVWTGLSTVGSATIALWALSLGDNYTAGSYLLFSALLSVSSMGSLAVQNRLWADATTELSRAGEALRQSHQQQRRLDARLRETQRMESLGLMAGSIAHDFNNILTAILASTQVAQQEATGEVREDLATIETSALRAAALVKHLLDFSGRGGRTLGTLDFGQLLRDARPMLQAGLPKQVTLHVEAEPDVRVDGDRVQLEQIIVNLVHNAAHAYRGRAGQVRARAQRVELSGELPQLYPPEPLPPGRYVALTVADDGIGIRPEHVARIFDPFFTTREEGRGLGLASVLGIARGHRGAIQVDSTEGVGTEMRVYLPYSSGLLPSSDGGEPASTPPLPPSRILVVDDERAIREVLAKALGAAGHTVTLADSGEQAQALVRGGARYDVALIDMSMPGQDGLTTFHALRAAEPSLPVVFMTGHSRVALSTELADEPRVRLVHKPFQLAALLASMAEVHASETPP
jgi:signal transduction histidine kinase/CheY-like chemotaxis protein